MQLPRSVVVGKEILANVGKTCRSLGFSGSALVLAGPLTTQVAAKVVVDSLGMDDFSVSQIAISQTSLDHLEQIQLRTREVKAELLVAVGGGRIIDAAKFISSRDSIPYISVPTAASHDGISSPQASIKHLGKAYTVQAPAPMAIVADVGIITQAPHRLTASGCGDIISKFTAVRDWWLAHYLKNEYYGEYASNLARMSARTISRNAEIIREGSEEGIRTVVEALISCGVAISIAGTSRPCSGSEHLFSHALDLLAPTPALHGEQCGVGTIMMAYLHRMNWRKIKSVLKKVGAPTNARELGIDKDCLIDALVQAHSIRPDRYTILGERGLTKDTAVKLARTTGVID